MYRGPRGTADLLPSEQKFWRYLESNAENVAERFGYRRIDTPVFEDSGLFVRGVGQGTDLVEKETYTFQDRGGDMLTLRAEGTAPVCRAYLEHGMHNLVQPVRLYYFTSIYRYERPQAGRYREHHQFGIEAIGDGNPAVDAEVIELGWRFLSGIGLQKFTIQVNSIGDFNCRPTYLGELKDYYAKRRGLLCDDCKVRFERNPLRLLDCKKENCLALSAEAPHSIDHLCGECQEHWDRLKGYLSALGLLFNIDHHLVRGLNYYTRTVFEIQPPVEGSQSAIIGGGRYDGLIQELGGRPTPGIGFGMGIERVILNLREQGISVPDQDGPKVMVSYIGDAACKEAIKLASQLRQEGISATLAPSGKSIKGQMRHAFSLGTAYAIIIGDNELQKGTLILRDMGKGEQQEATLAQVKQILQG
ncbi:MAG: histidine--tRNA ligase [Chloroflexi bacterium]|nr:histidine--tRNA ligase [Chloroflexota bacterium]